MSDPWNGPKVADFEGLHPWFAWVRDYLRDRAGDRRLPGRRDIDPGDFGPNLHLVNLVDVVREGGAPRFRFRLVGSAQSVMAKREITGRFVEEAVVPRYVERIIANMRAATESRMPVYDRFPMPHPDRDFIDSERVYYPMSADGEQVDMLLIACGYPGTAALAPRMPSTRKANIA